MATIKMPYGDTGLAAFEAGDEYLTVELFSGSSPDPVTENYPVASGVVIPAFSVVGVSGGNLVMAVSGTTQAIGITTAPANNVGAVQSVAIFRAGCFNPDALNWDASYSTDALKAAAFRTAPTPTNILVRKFL